MTFDNRNRGILGNNWKKTHENSPDMTGTLDVDGREYFIDGWLKHRKDGKGTFYSLRVKLKEVRTVRQEQDRRPEPTRAPEPRRHELDDDLPF
jgi:hypothetical protein